MFPGTLTKAGRARQRLYEKWIAVLNQANRLTINRIIEM